MLSLRQVLHNLTFANQLSFLRLASIPFFALALLNNRHGLAFGLFVAAAATDFLDGLIARILKQQTALGALLDPAADKLLMTTALVCLSLPDNIRIAPDFVLTNRLPLWLSVLAISRYLFIVLIAVLLYVSYGFTRFQPSRLGKTTTLAEAILVSFYLLFNSLRSGSSIVLPLFLWLTLGLILASGFHYIYRTIHLIRHAQSPEVPAEESDAPVERENARVEERSLRAVEGGGPQDRT